MITSPFGFWPSPLDAAKVAGGGVRLGELQVNEVGCWWIEGRPAESGRSVLVCCPRSPAGGEPFDVTPPGRSVRTRVHEYGGGSYALDGCTAYWSDQSDQRLWRQVVDTSGRSAGEPEPVTAPSPGGQDRFADGAVLPGGEWLVAVRERHGPGGAANAIVAVPLEGIPGERTEPAVLESGHDFVAAPRPSPDGRRLAWITWDNPAMPWDGTMLFVADLAWRRGPNGAPAPELVRVTPVMDDHGVSVLQPAWAPDGSLWAVSDASGWWNLARAEPEGTGRLDALTAVTGDGMEYTPVPWALGLATYGFVDGETVIACRCDHDVRPPGWRIGTLDRVTGTFAEIATPLDTVSSVRTAGGRCTVIGSVRGEAPCVATFGLESPEDIRVLRTSRPHPIAPGVMPATEHVEIPTAGGAVVHALWHAPRLEAYAGPPGVAPPLIVQPHGGPTGAAETGANLTTAFFTSRGFGVVDVDYRGSSGYGRAYREALRGQWGVLDAADCIDVAEWCAASGLADAAKIAIRGSSAGGFTVLCALVASEVFAAGVSYYGVADLELLAADTHKFEARYLDGLVGPYPEHADLYRSRSPVHHAEAITAPLLVFQGLDDPVVPPNQAEAIVAAVRARGLRCDYHTFAGEGHGFRQAATVQACLAAELSFYRDVLSLGPAPPQ